jgi:hypothetical protein
MSRTTRQNANENKPNPNRVGIILAGLTLPHPTSVDEAVEFAKAYRLMWDAYRVLELGLFVYVALVGEEPYLYPVAATDEDSAYCWAQVQHKALNLPQPDDWELI